MSNELSLNCLFEQTLDKKLMSNMRTKRSAHERQAGLVSAGEWSSGKQWADDAPREEVSSDAVSLVSMGSCGAFVHGLEDECFSVRVASVDSLTTLSMENHSLAVLALDFLVDMFNDEIEQVCSSHPTHTHAVIMFSSLFKLIEKNDNA